MEQQQLEKKPKPGANCLFCRISGTAVCLGISAYSYSIYRKTPITKVVDRRFSLVMTIGFAALGVYRGLLY